MIVIAEKTEEKGMLDYVYTVKCSVIDIKYKSMKNMEL